MLLVIYAINRRDGLLDRRDCLVGRRHDLAGFENIMWEYSSRNSALRVEHGLSVCFPAHGSLQPH